MLEWLQVVVLLWGYPCDLATYGIATSKQRVNLRGSHVLEPQTAGFS